VLVNAVIGSDEKPQTKEEIAGRNLIATVKHLVNKTMPKK
jgi:hypothetical protein